MATERMTIEEAQQMHPVNSFRWVKRMSVDIKARVIGHSQQGSKAIITLLLPKTSKYVGMKVQTKHCSNSVYNGENGTLEVADKLHNSYQKSHNNPPDKYLQSD